MLRQVHNAAITLGIMLVTGGMCATLYASIVDTQTFLIGWGPLDGPWARQDYFFLGAVLAVLGSGFFTFGLLNRRGNTSDS